MVKEVAHSGIAEAWKRGEYNVTVYTTRCYEFAEGEDSSFFFFIFSMCVLCLFFLSLYRGIHASRALCVQCARMPHVEQTINATAQAIQIISNPLF